MILLDAVAALVGACCGWYLYQRLVRPFNRRLDTWLAQRLGVIRDE